MSMDSQPHQPRDPREHQSRRTFSEAPPRNRKGLKDTDSQQSGVRAYALVAGALGAILGAALAVFLYKKEMAPLPVIALCPPIFAFALAYTTLWITNSAGAAGSTLYTPSGKTTPPKKEYSQAEAMVIQGRYEDGITAFELAITEDGTDPTPYLRIARIYRDNMARYEDAARWFRRAFRDSAIARGPAFLARKELVELYTHRLGDPKRALPELARMAEEMEGTEEGAWAARELADIKSRSLSSPAPEMEEDPPTTP
jgi:tetratricopeptide (TPR) repeat protein